MVDPGDLLGSSKETIARRIMGQVTPSEQPIAQALASTVAAVEHEQAEAVQELVDELDLTADVDHDAEARREVLLGTADAVSDERFAAFYFELLLDPVDNGDALEKYVGLEDVEEQKREWYQQYEGAELVDESFEDADQEAIDDVADRHLKEVHQIGIEEWQKAVVGFEQAEAAEHLLAGPFLAHTALVRQAAEEVAGLQERVDELEKELEEASE